jgi:hypothetical protein
MLNTDGFILQGKTLPAELMGTEHGQFKIANDKKTGKPRVGKCQVISSNSVKFI